jgi:Ca2+-binding RTX toxin-like protein
VTNTDLIDVAVPDVPESDTVAVDLSGGPLAPGATDEGDGSSEIEMEIDGVDGSFDTLQVIGSTGPDALAAGFMSVSLNANEQTFDEDVTVSDIGLSLELLGDEGNDFLSLASPGTALNSFGPTTVLAGPGDDRLSGDLEENDIDGGPGWDLGDYSWANGLNLNWEVGGGALVWAGSGEDQLDDVEVVLLTDGHDTVTYQGNATGETRTGGDADAIHVFDGLSALPSDDRIVRGGSGTFDYIEFHPSADQSLSIDLEGVLIRGSWWATYSGIEYLFAGAGDDRFRLTSRGTYPGLVGGDGKDVLSFRAATEGMSVTMGQGTFGPRKWVTTYEVERALGSDFDDVFLGPGGVSADPVEFIGFRGRDVMRGGEGPDLLVGGEGPDMLRGKSGPDTLRGWLGADTLEGGEHYDFLHGGPGNDLLNGGPGYDDCDGGPGDNSITGC